jgi:hypothetical protein
VTFVANAMNGLFDLLLRPFGGAAAWAMFVIAVLTGVVMLLLFKWSTNQDRLAVAKRRLLGHIYEMGLFQDNLRVLFKIQRDLALANLRYLAVTLPALLVLVPPVVLILAQLDARYAHRPFHVEERSLLTASVAPDHAELLDALSLAAPEGIEVETLPVRDHRALTATWRIRVQEPGDHELAVTAPDGRRWTKRLVADGDLPRLAGTREKAGLHFLMFNTAETPLPGESPLAAISLELPERQTRYLGVGMHWLVAFCLFSLVFGFALKDVFKVKI